MLHERRLPNDVANDIERVYQVKLLLLDWLLRTPPAALHTSAPLVQKFGAPVGNWLWSKIHKPQKRTKFGKAVIALADKAQGAAAQAAVVAAAIANDAQFHTQWAVAGYELQFPRLHADWLDPVRKVAEPFYHMLAKTGFDPTPFGLMGGKLDRGRVMDAFRPQSHSVCGYCDGPLGEKGTEFEANDCDHFFSKSHWPHLAIHPANLFSACKGCNSTWKLSKKPMGEADVQGLNDTYHPMFRPGANAVVVRATRSATNARLVDIKITDPVVQRRAATLVGTLDLNARWTNSVNEKLLDKGVSVFVAVAARHRESGQPVDAAWVRDVIDRELAWREINRGREIQAMREWAVFEYQRSSMLPDIIAELSHQVPSLLPHF